MEFHWSVILEYREALLWGIGRTLQLSAVSAVLALIIGIFIGILRTSKNSLFRLLGSSHVEFFRNPDGDGGNGALLDFTTQAPTRNIASAKNATATIVRPDFGR